VRYVQLAFIFGDSQVLSLPPQKYAPTAGDHCARVKNTDCCQQRLLGTTALLEPKQEIPPGSVAGTSDVGSRTPEALHLFNVPYHTIFFPACQTDVNIH